MTRLVLLAVCCLSLGAQAQWRRIRQPCASNGMSCAPGPCCRGTKCDDLGICRAPEKQWSEGRNPKEPGPDDKPKPQKKPPTKK